MYFGDFAEDATVYIPFNTFSSDDPSASVTITDLADADIKVHKDGGTTEIATDGATVAINFDSVTGNHLVTIDTSAHSDYSTGSDYSVRIEGTTVDGATINAFIGSFSIENRFNQTVVPDAAGVAATQAEVATECDTVTVTSIGANVITATAINADAITSAKIADNALANEHFADGALTSTEVTSVAGAAVTSIAANAITAASINAAAIDNATFAADVGSTAYATNIIALAVRKALDEINLDHLCKTATVGADMTAEVVDDTILSRILANGDTSVFDPSTDGLQPIRDHIGDGTNLTEAGGDGDQLTAINLPNQTMDITGSVTGNLIGDVTGNVDGTVAGVTPDAAGVAATQAEVATECADALSDIKLDHLINTAAAEDEVADNSVIARIAATEGDWSEYNDESHSLEAIRVRGDAAWTTGAGGTPPTTLQNTTIATLATQVSFTLTAGSADDDAYNGCIAIIEDQTTAVQKAVGRIFDYTGASKTITLEADPGVFTMATGDTIDIIAVEKTWKATTKALTDKAGFGLVDDAITASKYDESTAFPLTAVNGSTLTEAGGDGDHLTAINLPNQTMDITGDLSGSVGSVTAEVTADAVKISGSSDAADKLEASAETIEIGTVSHDNTVASTTVFYCDDITTAAADHYNGRIVIFTSGTLLRQATDITDYEVAAGEGKFTVTALTSAPADNVTFVIV